MNDSRDHDDIRDLIAVYALGALSARESQQAAEHLAACDACGEEFRSLRSTATAVGFAADDVPLDELTSRRMRRALMDAIATAPAPAADIAPRRSQRGPWVAAAALAAALVLTFLATNRRDADLRSQLANAQRELTESQRTLAQTRSTLEHDRSVVADLQAGRAQAFAVPHGNVVRSGDRLYLVMRGLPAPPKGRVYQAWTLAQGAKAVAPSVTFVPGEGGFVVVSLPESAVGIAAVAISVEPPGGSLAPTTKPNFIRPLS